jgi:hypothetical protein
MITVHHVPTHFVHKEWPLVAPFLEAALTNPEASGDITLDQMRADLGQNRSALYMFVGDLGAVGAASVVFQNATPAWQSSPPSAAKALPTLAWPLSSSTCCAEAALPVWRERVEIPSSGSGRGWA